MVLALLGILVSLAFLITLAYRGHAVIFVAPLAALIAMVLAGVPLLGTYTQIFMPAAGGFISSFFPLFLTGAVFGKLMSSSGYAHDFAGWVSGLLGAERAILVTVLATALLTYGGVSAWVIVFTIFPVAIALFEEADLPRRLIPPAIALGIFTFATAALPGSPQVHNTIPTRFFGTTTFAAPGLGLIGSVIVFGLGYAWLNRRQKQLVARGESFSDPTDLERRADEREQRDRALHAAPATGAPAEPLPGHEADDLERGHSGSTATVAPQASTKALAKVSTGAGLMALLPVLVVVVTNAVLTYLVIPQMDTSYLADKKYGGVALAQVLGIWSVTGAMLAAIVAIFLLRPSRFVSYFEDISDGAKNAVLPVFTTASEVGYGAVIASLAAFALIRDGIFGVSTNPLIQSALSTSVISGVTGSASGGLTITLNAFGAQLAQAAQAQGISTDLMHRATAMASTGFDSLPHNGAIVTLLLVCGLTHRESYKDIAVVTIAVPVIGVVAVCALGLAFGSF